jgi:hypothetical protein
MREKYKIKETESKFSSKEYTMNINSHGTSLLWDTYKRQRKNFLVSKHYAMRDMEIKLHTFHSLALGGRNGQFHTPVTLPLEQGLYTMEQEDM